VVMSNGARVALRSNISSLRSAMDASWYTTGAPVRVTAGNRAIEWTMAGSPTSLTSDVVAIGTVDGITLFARGGDVAAIRTRFDGRSADALATTLGTDRSLWSALEDVQMVYAPIDQVGCRFQPLQVRRPVTKG
jgi:hypothetical protein